MFYFILVILCIVKLIYVSNQRDAVLSSLFIVPQNHYIFRVSFAPIISNT